MGLDPKWPHSSWSLHLTNISCTCCMCNIYILLHARQSQGLHLTCIFVVWLLYHDYRYVVYGITGQLEATFVERLVHLWAAELSMSVGVVFAGDCTLWHMVKYFLHFRLFITAFRFCPS